MDGNVRLQKLFTKGSVLFSRSLACCHFLCGEVLKFAVAWLPRNWCMLACMNVYVCIRVHAYQYGKLNCRLKELGDIWFTRKLPHLHHSADTLGVSSSICYPNLPSLFYHFSLRQISTTCCLQDHHMFAYTD